MKIQSNTPSLELLYREALQDLFTKMADDELILGHRNSEWTGLGPVMEEDIAFSSMAQDKIGHALALYTSLREMTGIDPDHYAFCRKAELFKCCHLVEHPNGEYDFSLMRHFLFDAAETVRFQSMEDSSCEPLCRLARKFRGELKYHMMHATAWIIQLGQAGGESHEKMQTSLERCFPLALGIFEKGSHEQLLSERKVYPGEQTIEERWMEKIYPILSRASLNLPEGQITASQGGRQGKHTRYLAPLLEEMGEVFNLDPDTEW